MHIRKKQRAVVEALENIKARDIVVFNVSRLSPLFERVVVASGDSTRQVKALAENVARELKAIGAKVYGIEGQGTAEWMLVDLGDVVVHVMHPTVRSHYNLEEIWGGKEVNLKAPVPVKPPPAKVKSKNKAKAKTRARAPAKRPAKPRAKRAKAAPRRRRR